MYICINTYYAFPNAKQSHRGIGFLESNIYIGSTTDFTCVKKQSMFHVIYSTDTEDVMCF